MKKDIASRVIEEAEYLIKTKKTVREIAVHFGVSKSTVHKDMHERLQEIDKDLFQKVNVIMQEHIEERHIRGGESTRKKYLSTK